MATPTKLISIHGKLFSPQEKLYGVFFIVINQETDYIDTTAVVISKYSEVYEQNLDVSFKKLDTFISHTKYKGHFNQSVTMDMQDSLTGLPENPSIYKNLLAELKKKNKDSLKKTIYSLFYRIMRDDKIEVELLIRPVSQEELQEEIKIEEKISGITSDDILQTNTRKLPEGSYLQVGLIVDPVSGKVISDVKIGDKIFVKLDPNHGRTVQFIDSYKLRNGEKILPCPATIFNKYEEDGYTHIIFQIDQQIFAKVSEKEKVMLKVATQNDVNLLQNKKAPSLNTNQKSLKSETAVATSQSSNKPILFAGIGIAAILLLVISYIILS